MPTSVLPRLLNGIPQFLVVLVGSCVAGTGIGILQHYVSFGIWGYGFGLGPFGLAVLEGGFTGLMFAIPTGLITFYLALRRTVDVKGVAIICAASLVAGCAMGVAFFWASAFLTPIVTIMVAMFVHCRVPSVTNEVPDED